MRATAATYAPRASLLLKGDLLLLTARLQGRQLLLRGAEHDSGFLHVGLHVVMYACDGVTAGLQSCLLRFNVRHLYFRELSAGGVEYIDTA
jgi:hypothetical protein